MVEAFTDVATPPFFNVLSLSAYGGEWDAFKHCKPSSVKGRLFCRGVDVHEIDSAATFPVVEHFSVDSDAFYDKVRFVFLRSAKVYVVVICCYEVPYDLGGS